MAPATRRSLRNISKAAAQNLQLVIDESRATNSSKVKDEQELISIPLGELQLQDLSNAGLFDPSEPKKSKNSQRSDASTSQQNENVSPGSIPTAKFELISTNVKQEEIIPKVEKVSFFEMQRRKNLEENMKFLGELELTSSASVLAPVVKAKPVKRVFKKVEYTEVLPRRSSVRLINAKLKENFVEPDYKFESLPNNYEDPVTVKHKRVANPRPFSGALQNVDDVTTDENLKTCFKEVIADKSFEKRESVAEEEVLESLQKLAVADSDVVKCCIGRVYDAKFHPSNVKILIATADKYGSLGFWDVNKESSGLFLTQPHSLPVRHIDFSPSDSTKLFTCSYDGTLKCVDLVASEFTTVCKNVDPRSSDEYNEFHWFDFLNDKQTMCVGEQLGKIFIVDPRCSGTNTGDSNSGATSDTQANPVAKFPNGLKPIKCISAHPTKPYILASDYTSVKVWDIRTTKRSCIDELYHGKVANGAFFSPLTGDKILTTCSDDFIRVFDSTNLGPDAVKETIKIYHDNRTGRWLAPFQAVWHPNCEDLFIVGCMDSYRKIDVFSTSNRLPVLKLIGNETICCRNAFHPQLNMVVGTTSSGKAYLWR